MSGEKTTRLRFELRSYWHAGTGGGRGAQLDGLVQRDRDGLPILPGRTVKGLVRDAVQRAEAWGHLKPGSTALLFGTQGVEEGITRLETEPGLLGFGNAALPPEVAAWLADRETDYRETLFREIHSTAVDPATGSARDHSLRGIEVTVPLELWAPVTPLTAADGIDWQHRLRTALPLIRAVGAHRSRGLGRVVVTLEEDAA